MRALIADDSGTMRKIIGRLVKDLGFEFVEAFRGKPGNAECQVMMITTESEMANMDAALSAGANEYLVKPFDKDALIGVA